MADLSALKARVDEFDKHTVIVLNRATGVEFYARQLNEEDVRYMAAESGLRLSELGLDVGDWKVWLPQDYPSKEFFVKVANFSDAYRDPDERDEPATETLKLLPPEEPGFETAEALPSAPRYGPGSPGYGAHEAAVLAEGAPLSADQIAELQAMAATRSDDADELDLSDMENLDVESLGMAPEDF